MKSRFSKTSMKFNSTQPKDNSIDSTALIRFPPLPKLTPLTFPTFSELVGESVNEQPAKRKEIGLFEGLLGADPTPLYHDLIGAPYKYRPGTDVLLQQLIQGQKSVETLTPEELLLLDQATFDFTQLTKPPPKEEPIQIQREDPADQLPELKQEAEQGPVDPPKVEKFWWRKNQGQPT